MAQRIEFRFGKNSSFECDIEQIIAASAGEPFEEALKRGWVPVRLAAGAMRFLNVNRCTQVIIGAPDAAPPKEEVDK